MTEVLVDVAVGRLGEVVVNSEVEAEAGSILEAVVGPRVVVEVLEVL